MGCHELTRELQRNRLLRTKGQIGDTKQDKARNPEQKKSQGSHESSSLIARPGPSGVPHMV
jgi:hypothetical protein